RRGRGLLFIGDKQYTVDEGQGMLLFPRYPNERHEYYSIDGEWYTDWVIFTGNGIGPFIEETMGLSDSAVLFVSSPSRIAEKIDELYYSAQHGISFGSQSSLLVYDILLDLKALTSVCDRSTYDDRMRRIEPVISYINKNCAAPLSLGELASVAHVSSQYLCVLFREVTSRTVFEYVNMARIRRSKELMLNDNTLTIRQVAEKSGFSSESYYCAVFRRHEKMTPAEFRSMNGKESNIRKF
nr:AraC family transcriptional regulator [Clostridiales bacterium]